MGLHLTRPSSPYWTEPWGAYLSISPSTLPWDANCQHSAGIKVRSDLVSASPGRKQGKCAIRWSPNLNLKSWLHLCIQQTNRLCSLPI